jgi:hypothetical protein
MIHPPPLARRWVPGIPIHQPRNLTARIGLPLVIAVAASLKAPVRGDDAEGRPNIVFIFSDD